MPLIIAAHLNSGAGIKKRVVNHDHIAVVCKIVTLAIDIVIIFWLIS